jgi:hypothetical protein
MSNWEQAHPSLNLSSVNHNSVPQQSSTVADEDQTALQEACFISAPLAKALSLKSAPKTLLVKNGGLVAWINHGMLDEDSSPFP